MIHGDPGRLSSSGAPPGLRAKDAEELGVWRGGEAPHRDTVHAGPQQTHLVDAPKHLRVMGSGVVGGVWGGEGAVTTPGQLPHPQVTWFPRAHIGGSSCTIWQGCGGWGAHILVPFQFAMKRKQL